ncbi:ABC transporter substrate-binding protein [soil metagenome]
MALAVLPANEKTVPAFIPRPILTILLCLAVPAMPTAAMAAPAEGAPRRIVSLNMCADQLLIALADPGQIAALTQFARDPAMSAEAVRAARLPISRGAAEDVLALNPDLILTSPFRSRGAAEALKRQSYRTIDIPPAESYAAIVAEIRTVAQAVGHPERGTAMIAQMNAQLSDLRTLRGRPVAAYYQRRGYLTGTGTLVDELMQRVGLRNLAQVLGKPALARLTVEEMVAARPDYLIIESDSDTVTDQGTEMLHHPALADIPRLHLPQAWTVCGGPSYAKAARSLADQLSAHRKTVPARR